MFTSLKPRPDKSIPFLIFLSFLITFVVSRIITGLFPSFFIPIRGTHVHHFAYGIVLLSVIGFYALVVPPSPKGRLRLGMLYGVALGLAYDEFAMWLQLDDLYRYRVNYDAIIVISLTMLNVIYFGDFWNLWGRRLGKLLNILLLGLPKKVVYFSRKIGT